MLSSVGNVTLGIRRVFRCRPADFSGRLKVNVLTATGAIVCVLTKSAVLILAQFNISPHCLFMIQNQITVSLCLTIAHMQCMAHRGRLGGGLGPPPTPHRRGKIFVVGILITRNPSKIQYFQPKIVKIFCGGAQPPPCTPHISAYGASTPPC